MKMASLVLGLVSLIGVVIPAKDTTTLVARCEAKCPDHSYTCSEEKARHTGSHFCLKTNHSF